MANVTQYSVLFYGSTDGAGGTRAQIQLYDGTTSVGFVRFHDSNAVIPADSQSGGVITMHLPSTMFPSVIDVLRNEKPINYYFVSSAALGTGTYEPVGEGD